ncbi:MAG: hypothetical protein KIT68_08155 [Phycisphaeraceae bacterium]|nr:hypothetical protein [Phycisphaeraceae bacterium]
MLVPCALLSWSLVCSGVQAQPAPSALPEAPPHSATYRGALFALHDRLKAPAPAITPREQVECVDWMRRANPAIARVLVGHHVIVLATDGFAERAAKSDFVLNFDLGYEVLVHLFAADPCLRVGRRFVIWPDPDMSGGHRCIKAELRIHVGRGDWDNAEWLERYFHEMTHGFQFEHPATHLMLGGFFEGWAEFMQGAVTDHLAPLGAPFAGRGDYYADHFPKAARFEYLQTRLPIEEIISYDPAAGLLMELVNTSKTKDGRRDWAPLRNLLRRPFTAPRWTPWHLWPAMMASDILDEFGEAKARPILAKFRFPLDRCSLERARAQNWGSDRPDPSPRTILNVEHGWSALGPFENGRRYGIEWDPLDAEDMAWRWCHVAPDAPTPPSDPARNAQWRAIKPDASGTISLDGPAGGPAYFYLATTLPSDLRTPLTLYISSDDECAVWLDGELIHFYRGTRGCTPDHPDVAYADASGTRGQIVVLVMNHGGAAGFSLAVDKGGPLFEGFEQRFADADAMERAAAVSYLASRRLQQPVKAMLARAAKDPDERVRRATKWWRDARPSAGDFREAEEAYFRGSIAGGFYWNNEGASGNQCVARGWGERPANWLSLPLEVKTAGPQKVRIRYACPVTSQLRVKIRRGDRFVFESEMLKLKPTGKDWNTWSWRDVAIPESAKLEPGVYHIELVEPSGDGGKGADIDVIGIAPQ